jgi:hypothetical protein
MVFAVSLFKSCSCLAGATNISGTSAPSITPDNIPMDLDLATTADKAVKAILPFLKEVSNDEWWNRLLASWINFEVKGPPKSVIFFDNSILYVLIFHIIATPK